MKRPGHHPGNNTSRVTGRLTVVVAITALIALVASMVTSLPTPMRPAAAQAASGSPFAVPGRGATVPFTEIEAEDAATNGAVIGPDRVYTHLPSEASGRGAVRLSAAGQYVEFTLTKPANAMTVRYSVPDNAAGTGLTAPVDLRVNGAKLKDLSFTSRYGWYYGGYPFGNNPGAGSPHHFYDETRTMFGSTLAAGAKVRVQVASTSVSPWFVVDLADFELVPDPIARPAGSLSVEDYGADRTGAADSTAAAQAAVDAGRTQGRVVWIPQGTFKVTNHVIVDNVTLRGAGPWYSVLGGNHVGVYGRYVADGGPSRNVQLRDFAIMGEVMERNDGDQVNAIGGAMSDSVVSNVWMQHNKVGAWMDGPMNNFTITGSRILDQTADGVNFHRGVTDSTVTNTFVRNMGDDGLAMWAETDNNVGNKFTFNTVVVPVLANNIAIYGGRDITVSDNVLTDTVTNGGGLHVGNRYPGVQGPTAVSGNSGWYTSTPYCGPWPAPVYDGGGGNPTPTPTPTPPGCQVGTGNVALRKPISASGHTQSYVAANAADGDAGSYWESPNNAFPQTLTVDLCGTVNARRVVLKLPPSAAWATRTQTIAVLGSANGTDLSTLAGAAGVDASPSEPSITARLPVRP